MINTKDITEATWPKNPPKTRFAESPFFGQKSGTQLLAFSALLGVSALGWMP